MKRITGTTVDTVHCFQEPTDPISSVDGLDVCTAKAAGDLPTPSSRETATPMF